MLFGLWHLDNKETMKSATYGFMRIIAKPSLDAS